VNSATKLFLPWVLFAYLSKQSILKFHVFRNAQELRMEKIQLELENQDMERKLQEFQLTRNKEKEEIK
jgi:hypothetical protein